METPWPWLMNKWHSDNEKLTSLQVGMLQRTTRTKRVSWAGTTWMLIHFDQLHLIEHVALMRPVSWWSYAQPDARKGATINGWLFQRCNHQRSLEAGPDHITLLAHVRLMYYGVFLSPENCLGTMMDFMQVARVACNSHIGLPACNAVVDDTQIWSDLYSIFSTLSNVLKTLALVPSDS